MFSKYFSDEEAIYELNKIKDKTHDFQKFKTIRTFGREIYNNDLSLNDALNE